jgi:poly(A) polymerase
MLRAIKFSARLGLELEPATYDALLRYRDEVRKCPPPRVLEEVYRLLRGGAARRSLEILVETGVLEVLSPHLSELFEGPGAPVGGPGQAGAADDDQAPDDEDLDDEERAWHRLWSSKPEPIVRRRTLRSEGDGSEFAAQRTLAWNLLREIDTYVAAGNDASNALAIAALLGPFALEPITAPGSRPNDANAAILELGQPLIDQLHVPRRDAERARQILLFQRRVVPARRRRGRPEAVAGRDFFDDAVVLFELTERAAGRAVPETESLRQADAAAQPAPVLGPAPDDDEPRKRRRRRRGGRRSREDGSDVAAS